MLAGIEEKLPQQNVEKYIEKVEEARKASANSQFPWAEWTLRAENILKEMLLEILQIDDPDQIPLCFCVSGSLAKGQATAQSDVDCFVIVKNKQDVERVKAAMVVMEKLCLEIFDRIGQFYPDPVGISPSKLCNTVEELAKLDNVVDAGVVKRAILGAKPTFGDPQLLVNLQQTISANEDRKEIVKEFYERAVTVYSGPRTEERVHIKSDILRPIEFILAGLRAEFKIYYEDGSHLSAKRTIKALKETGKISPLVANIILSLLNDVLSLRFEQHLEAKKENDDLILDDLNPEEQNKVREMIDKVAILRGIAADRLDKLEQGEDTSQLAFAITDESDFPYLSEVHKKEEGRVFDLKLFKSAAPLKQGINSIIADIHSYLIQAYPINPIQSDKSIVDLFEGAVPSVTDDKDTILGTPNPACVRLVKDWLEENRKLDPDAWSQNSREWVLKNLYEFRRGLLEMSGLLRIFAKTSLPGGVEDQTPKIKEFFDKFFMQFLALRSEAIATNNKALQNTLMQIQISLVDLFNLFQDKANAKARAFYEKHKEEVELVQDLTESFNSTFFQLWRENFSPRDSAANTISHLEEGEESGLSEEGGETDEESGLSNGIGSSEGDSESDSEPAIREDSLTEGADSGAESEGEQDPLINKDKLRGRLAERSRPSPYAAVDNSELISFQQVLAGSTLIAECYEENTDQQKQSDGPAKDDLILLNDDVSNTSSADAEKDGKHQSDKARSDLRIARIRDSYREKLQNKRNPTTDFVILNTLYGLERASAQKATGETLNNNGAYSSDLNGESFFIEALLDFLEKDSLNASQKQENGEKQEVVRGKKSSNQVVQPVKEVTKKQIPIREWMKINEVKNIASQVIALQISLDGFYKENVVAEDNDEEFKKTLDDRLSALLVLEETLNQCINRNRIFPSSEAEKIIKFADGIKTKIVKEEMERISRYSPIVKEREEIYVADEKKILVAKILKVSQPQNKTLDAVLTTALSTQSLGPSDELAKNFKDFLSGQLTQTVFYGKIRTYYDAKSPQSILDYVKFWNTEELKNAWSSKFGRLAKLKQFLSDFRHSYKDEEEKNKGVNQEEKLWLSIEVKRKKIEEMLKTVTTHQNIDIEELHKLTKSLLWLEEKMKIEPGCEKSVKKLAKIELQAASLEEKVTAYSSSLKR